MDSGLAALGALGPEPGTAAASGPGGRGPGGRRSSPGRMVWRRFRRHRLALGSAGVLAVVTVLVYFPSLVTGHDPLRASPGGPTSAVGPSLEYPLGTSTIGIDQLARVLHGGQVSLTIGLVVALAAGAVGVVVGSAAGYYRGWLDNVLMRVTDLFLAVPLLVVVILMSRLPERRAWAATVLGGPDSSRSVITLLALFLWMPMARIVRGQVIALKEREFVEAARAIGAPDRRILWRHLVPNCLGPVIVAATLTVASAILLEATVSYLGFGIDSSTAPSWGQMVSADKGAYDVAPWLVLGPGTAIFLVVLCVNFLGDGLRDAFDPARREAP
ncbi:MAG: ABC transporter permease [Acidimicrobiia bacterium]